MAAALLPKYFTEEGPTKTNPVVTSFEKELGYLVNALQKNQEKPVTGELKQKL